jgi:RHS repeat-associated protein
MMRFSVCASAVFFPSRCTGKERDAETGLDFFEARYFSSVQGRFTSPDPLVIFGLKPDVLRAHLANPQTWDKYAYVVNSPLTATDPSGLDTYAVLYTTGNSEGQQEMERAAQTRADEIRSSPGFDVDKDTVILQGVKTRDDFASALNGVNSATKEFGPVRELDLFAHSGIDGPVFHEDSAISKNNPNGAVQLSPENISGLPKLNWAGGASATFSGCRTWHFASEFARAEHVTTFGTPTYANFSSNPLYMWPDKGGKLYLKSFWLGAKLWGPNPSYVMDKYDPK